MWCGYRYDMEHHSHCYYYYCLDKDCCALITVQYD
jgi:hypothetical protein